MCNFLGTYEIGIHVQYICEKYDNVLVKIIFAFFITCYNNFTHMTSKSPHLLLGIT